MFKTTSMIMLDMQIFPLILKVQLEFAHQELDFCGTLEH